MFQKVRRFALGLTVIVLAQTIQPVHVLASDEGMIAADQVSQAVYYDLMDTYLYTHTGDNRGPSGPDLVPARNNIQSLMQSYGLSVVLESFSYGGGTYHNVVGTKVGTLYPNQHYIIGAHYDSVNNPGADDNASGVALVLEAARILSQYDSDYTIKFIAFSMEEQGLIGSQAYVDSHVSDDILGMISADMVAYDPGTDHALVYGRTASNPIKNALAAAIAEYGDGLTYTIGGDTPYSDHAPFEADGYQACLLIEGEVWDNPYYHQQSDNFENPSNLNFPYAVKMTRSIVGWLVDAAGVDVPVAKLVFDFPAGLPELTSPLYGADIEVTISGEGGVTPVAGTGVLHYDIGSGWQSVSMTETSANHYTVNLPGGDCGLPVPYYFSAQAVSGDTYTNPPGAPANYHEAVSADAVNAVFDFPLNSNPGWTTEGQWQFGTPTGGGGVYHGGPDPTSGHTGSYVYGYNLNGDYTAGMSETHLTTAPLDCTGLHGIHLRFWRWLGVEQPLYDHAYVRVRANGGAWQTIWENTAEITDANWVDMEFDISAIADDQPAVEIRWTMGSTDSGWEYCGWNIDDVSLTAYDCIVGCAGDLGDMNHDDVIDGQDLQLFVEAVCGSYDPCADLAGQDGQLDSADVQAMVTLLLAAP